MKKHLNKHMVKFSGILLGLALSAASCALGPTGETRVLRGGSAGRPAKEVRSGNWGDSGPDSQTAGFRLVKSW